MKEVTLTIPTPLLNPKAANGLGITPSMATALYALAAELDRKRVPPFVDNAIWLSIPTVRLKANGARDDNAHLRRCLNRLLGLKLEGEYRGDQWGAVLIAEWHLEKGATVARILVPPAAVRALRTPETFSKIEANAVYNMEPNARRLYLMLADKKWLRAKQFDFGLDDLRAGMGLPSTVHQRWDNFRRVVLLPSIQRINQTGAVTVAFKPIKQGKAIVGVRLSWDWKNPDQAQETLEEVERHSSAQFAPPVTTPDAPPLMEKTHLETAKEKEFAARFAERVQTFRERAGRAPAAEEIEDIKQRLRDETQAERSAFVAETLKKLGHR